MLTEKKQASRSSQPTLVEYPEFCKIQNSKFKIQSPNVWVSMRFIIINEFWFTWFKFKDRKLACVCGTCQHLLEKRIIYLFLPCASYNFDFLFIIFYLNMVDISEDPPPLLVRARKISFIFFFHLSNFFRKSSSKPPKFLSSDDFYCEVEIDN